MPEPQGWRVVGFEDHLRSIEEAENDPETAS